MCVGGSGGAIFCLVCTVSGTIHYTYIGEIQSEGLLDRQPTLSAVIRCCKSIRIVLLH